LHDIAARCRRRRRTCHERRATARVTRFVRSKNSKNLVVNTRTDGSARACGAMLDIVLLAHKPSNSCRARACDTVPRARARAARARCCLTSRAARILARRFSRRIHVIKSTFSAQHAGISISHLRWRERVEQRALRRGCNLAMARDHFGSPGAAREGGTAHAGRASIGTCTASTVATVLTCRSSCITCVCERGATFRAISATLPTA